MPGVVLEPHVPAVDPSNGTTVSLSEAGTLQLSVGGAEPVAVGGDATVHTNATMTGDGSVEDPLGVVSVGWDATQWARITSVLGTQVDEYDWTDLLHAYEYDISQGNARPFAPKAGTTGGVLWGPNANAGQAYLTFAGQAPGASGAINAISNQKTQAWATVCRVTIAGAIGAGDDIRFGMFDAANTENEAFVGFKGAVSTTVLQLTLDNVDAGGSVVRTAANAAGTIGSGITLGTPFDLMVVNDVANGTFAAYVNGTLVALTSTLTNFPITGGSLTCFVLTSQHNVQVDAMLYAFKRGT